MADEPPPSKRQKTSGEFNYIKNIKCKSIIVLKLET